MRLATARLKNGQHNFSFHSDNDPWLKNLSTAADNLAITLPITLELALTKSDPDYYFRGKLGFALERGCDRCTELFTKTIEAWFSLALVHTAKPSRTKQSNTDESDELDLILFDKDEIDLAPLLQEQIALGIPFTGLCNDRCRGLCQECGTNLNLAQCTCRSDKPVGPFDVLASMQLG